VCAVACTDVGRKRSNNEDSFLVFDLASCAIHAEEAEAVFELVPPGLLLAVADGMGGHQSGQVASQVCIETVTAEFLRALKAAEREPSIDWPQVLTGAVAAANVRILDMARENPEHHGMGTTLTAALLTGKQVAVAQVGDSRAYLFRHGMMIQLTRDQTVGNSLLALHQAMKTDRRFAEMLVQAVGVVDKLDVELTSRELELGDCLLICCDGLYKMVDAVSIAEVLQSNDSLAARAKELIVRANAAGGLDNVTVVLGELGARMVEAGSSAA